MGNFTKKLNRQFTREDSAYKREIYQSYFTAPEWRNVEMAEEFAAFLKAGKPFYQYPFFKQIKTFWSIFGESYKAARAHHSHYEILTSEYMLMNVFIGAFSTISFGMKGFLSLCLAPLLKQSNESQFQKHVAELVTDYATFIHKIPFFNYSYFEKLKGLHRAFKNADDKSVADYIGYIMTTSELLIRGIVSKPVAWWYNQPENTADEVIHLLVKTKNAPLDVQRLQTISPAIKIIGDIRSRHSQKKSADYNYAHITVPRYEAFQETVQNLIEANVKIKRIAGQDRIHIKAVGNEAQQFSVGLKRVLFSYQNHINDEKMYGLDIPTKELEHTVKSFNHKGICIRTMHDY